MKRLLIAALVALALAGCSGNNTSDLPRTADGLACIDSYSYLVGTDGSYTPSPETLAGYEDYECKEES